MKTLVIAFLCSVYTLPALAAAKSFDYCSKDRVATVFSDNDFGKTIPGWVSVRLESASLQGKGYEEIRGRLAGKGPGSVSFEPAEESILYAEANDLPAEDPLIIPLGKSAYLVSLITGSGAFVSADIAKEKGTVLHVTELIGDIYTNNHIEYTGLTSGGDVEFGYIHHKPYIYAIYYAANKENGSFVRLYALDDGNVKKYVTENIRFQMI